MIHAIVQRIISSDREVSVSLLDLKLFQEELKQKSEIIKKRENLHRVPSAYFLRSTQ